MPFSKPTDGRHRSHKAPDAPKPPTKSTNSFSNSLNSFSRSVFSQSTGTRAYKASDNMSQSIDKTLMKLSRFLPRAKGDPGDRSKTKSQDAASSSGESDEIEREHGRWAQQAEKAERETALGEWEHLEINDAGVATVQTVISDATKGVVSHESVVEGAPGGPTQKREGED